MAYDTFIFDFDFTLADASTGIVRTMNYAFGELGLPSKPAAEIKKTIGMSLDETFVELTKITDESQISEFKQHFKKMADEIMTDSTKLFDDTIDILTRLKNKNCKTAIVTNKYRYRIEDVLAKNNMQHLIDLVIGYEDVKQPKPSPEGLIKAIQYFSMDKRKVLYIGDSMIDAKVASDIDVDFAAITTGTTQILDFVLVPHVIMASSLTEFYALVKIFE